MVLLRYRVIAYLVLPRSKVIPCWTEIPMVVGGGREKERCEKKEIGQ